MGVQMATFMIKVISLSSDQSRRDLFCSTGAGDCDIEWSFFDACSEISEPLIYDAAKAAIAKGRPLTKGERGCYSSHYNVWLNFIESSYSHLIVFEDDVMVDWAYIYKLMKEISDNEIPGILRLFTRSAPRFRSSGFYADRYLIQMRSFPSGAQGYILNKDAAARLLNFCQIMDRPIDDKIDSSWEHGVSNFAIFPYPLYEKSLPSSIGDKERIDCKIRLTFTQNTKRIYKKT